MRPTNPMTTADSIMAEHKAFIEQADRDLKDLIQRADSQLQSLLAPTKPTPTLSPQSVWTESPDGEKLLVLNTDAVKVLNDLFGKVDEVVKLAAKS